MLSAVALASSAPFYSSAAATMPSSVPALASCITGRVRGSHHGATVLECLAASSSMRDPTPLPSGSIHSGGRGSGSCSGFVALGAQRSVGNGGGEGSNIARSFFSSAQSTRGRPRWAIPSVMALPATTTRGRCMMFRQQQQLSPVYQHYDALFSTIGAADAALGSAGGSVCSKGGRRRCRGASSRCSGRLMASVMDKDIMREVAAAAAGAASSTRSPRDVAGSGDAPGQVIQKQEARAADVDDERPTGYK